MTTSRLTRRDVGVCRGLRNKPQHRTLGIGDSSTRSRPEKYLSCTPLTRPTPPPTCQIAQFCYPICVSDHSTAFRARVRSNATKSDPRCGSSWQGSFDLPPQPNVGALPGYEVDKHSTDDGRLYITNLPSSKIQKYDLRLSLYTLFSTYGPVLDVVAMKTMKMRGQAHIVFRDAQTATQAMRALKGFEFFGHELVSRPCVFLVV